MTTIEKTSAWRLHRAGLERTSAWTVQSKSRTRLGGGRDLVVSGNSRRVFVCLGYTGADWNLGEYLCKIRSPHRPRGEGRRMESVGLAQV